MKSSDQKISRIILLYLLLALIALLLGIICQAYLGSFSRYIADDYCTTEAVKTLGFVPAQIDRRLSWDGRYSFSFFIMLFGLLGDKFPSILPAISMVFYLFSALFLTTQLFNLLFSKKNYLIIFLISSIFVFFTLYSIPQIGEDVYWMTGITTYLFPIILEMLLLGSLAHFIPKFVSLTKFKRVIVSLLFFVFAFVLSGFSEVTTAIHVVLFGLLLTKQVITMARKHIYSKNIICMVLPFFGALLGFVIMAISPGNAIRMNALSADVHPTIISLFSNVLVISAFFIFNWLTNYSAIIWATGIFMFFLGIYYSSSPLLEVKANFQRIRSFLLLLILFSSLLIFIAFIPSYWVNFSVPPNRAIILPVAILVGLIITVPFMTGLIFPYKNETIYEKKVISLCLITVCLYFTLSIPISKTLNYYNKNIETQIQFSKIWDQNDQMVKTQKNEGKENIVVKKIVYPIMELEQLYSDPGEWTNQCTADYYHVKQIIAR